MRGGGQITEVINGIKKDGYIGYPSDMFETNGYPSTAAEMSKIMTKINNSCNLVKLAIESLPVDSDDKDSMDLMKKKKLVPIECVGNGDWFLFSIADNNVYTFAHDETPCISDNLLKSYSSWLSKRRVSKK